MASEEFLRVPHNVMTRLSSAVTRLTAQNNCTAETLANVLQREASKLQVPAQRLLEGIQYAQQEVGRNFARGRVGELSSAAKYVANAIEAIPAAQMRTALATAATAAPLASTAGAGGLLAGLTVGKLILGGVLLAAAGLATYGLATYAGSRSGDTPVVAGEAQNKVPSTPVVAPPPAHPLDMHAVFLLTNVASGSVWIGQEATLKTAFTCNFGGGGLCEGQKYTTGAPGANIPVQYVKKSADFKTKDEAAKAYCTALQSEPRNIQLAFGAKAKIFGGDYWVDLAPRCSGS